MRFGFRVATDPEFGAGHLTRCRAVALALGEDVALFADPGELPDTERRNWTQIVSEESPESADAAIEALSLRRIDALVIDSYAINSGVVANAAATGTIIAFRDDRPYGPEQITIDCNPGANPSASTLAGSDFMPLSPIFAEMHERARRSPVRTRMPVKLVIAFGARDSANCTAIALDAVSRLSEKPRTAVALAASAQHKDLIMHKLEGMPWAERLDDRQAMNGLYGDFDFAIGAPGVSQFERACCGLPTILLAQNEKQKSLIAAWAESGAAIRCDSEAQMIADDLLALMSDSERLSVMRERGLDMVDGRGALRLAEALKTRLAR